MGLGLTMMPMTILVNYRPPLVIMSAPTPNDKNSHLYLYIYIYMQRIGPIWGRRLIITGVERAFHMERGFSPQDSNIGLGFRV